MPVSSRAVVLLSGGLDSYTAAAIVRAEGSRLHALTVWYGQVHGWEIEAARRAACNLDVADHLELDVDLAAIGGSALTGTGLVPKERDLDSPEVPATYVPARNTVFLALALARAEVLGARDIVIGANAIDYSGYPDCRPAFLEAFERLALLGTKAGIDGSRFRIRAPLLTMSKAEIIRRGLALGLDYSLTHSCYDPTPEGFRAPAVTAVGCGPEGFRKPGYVIR